MVSKVLGTYFRAWDIGCMVFGSMGYLVSRVRVHSFQGTYFLTTPCEYDSGLWAN